jgi:hypothetical protein
MPHWQNQHRDTCLDVDSDSSSKSLHRDFLDMPQPSESSPRPGAGPTPLPTNLCHLQCWLQNSTVKFRPYPGAGPTLPHPRTRRGYTSSAAAPRARPVTVRSGRCEHSRSRRQSSRSARRLSVAGTAHPFKFPPPLSIRPSMEARKPSSAEALWERLRTAPHDDDWVGRPTTTTGRPTVVTTPPPRPSGSACAPRRPRAASAAPTPSSRAASSCRQA